eukprot:3359365-Pyramimonas_sp.AAC.1
MTPVPPGPAADGGGALQGTLTGPAASKPPPRPPPSCSHPIESVRYYGNRHGSGSRCGLCGQRLVWVPRGVRTDGGPPPLTATEAARAAAGSAQRVVDMLQSDPQFRAGTAALNTVNSLGSLLQGLQWQLQGIPEGVRALGRVQEVLDQMAAVAMNVQSTPTQVEEGLQQIFQQLLQLRSIMTAFE